MVSVHAEGDHGALDALLSELGDGAAVEEVKPEGHEQFAIRGVSAGIFVVQEHQATSHHYDLRLEVDGTMRSWAVPKEPSMDPAVKRMAIQVEDHSIEHAGFEGELGEGWVEIWDEGTYEQGGRVPWPEALERGHAVFVLHGEQLRGGFALQRTRGGDKPQWLLQKVDDRYARPGDVAEQIGGDAKPGAAKRPRASAEAKPGVTRQTMPPEAGAVTSEEFLAREGLSGDLVLQLGEERVELTSLERPYWNRPKITKGDLLRYYLTASPAMMPSWAVLVPTIAEIKSRSAGNAHRIMPRSAFSEKSSN